jgi:hypothetical protein
MSKNKVEVGLSFRDRSKDMQLMRMSRKYSLGELVSYYPLYDNKFSFIEMLKLNFKEWKKSFNYLFKRIDTSKKMKARICGFVVENGATKYLLNKSVRNIFSITEKQITES